MVIAGRLISELRGREYGSCLGRKLNNWNQLKVIHWSNQD